MREKLYNFIPFEERKYLSLNFILSEKITVDWKTKDIKSMQIKVQSSKYHNGEYFCMLYHKHITRYLTDVSKLEVIKI